MFLNSESKSSVPMIKDIGILVLLLLLAGSGFLFYQEQKKNQELVLENQRLTTELEQKDKDLELLEELQQEQMFASAREYIKQYSVEGMEVEFRIIKELENWALLEATPINVETDNVAVILEKIDGRWKTHTFGTILPGWKERVPELFE